ncbi:MAG TPA: hypothetical protein VM100_01350, partial [Longimicrobiales bacterium]|nr:hypothetical protein [Longimicrobiales bacterium]
MTRAAAALIALTLTSVSAGSGQNTNRFSPSATIKDGQVHSIMAINSAMWTVYWNSSNNDTLPRLSFDGLKDYGFAIVGENPAKPAAAELHAFSVNASGNMVHSRFAAPAWTAWQNMSGQFLSRPAAAYYGDKVYVFGLGTDNRIWYASGSGDQFSNWMPITGGNFVTGASAAAGPDGIWVVATDANSVVWKTVFDGQSGSPWVSLGCCAHKSSEPTVIWMRDNIYEVLIRGTDQLVYDKGFATGGEGVAWSKLNGATQASVAVVRDANMDAMMILYGTDGNDWYATRKSTTGWSKFARFDAPRLTGPYITDITVVAGSSSSVACPAGYLKNPQDLNAGAGGDYIYQCVKYGQKDDALADINLINWGKLGATDGYTQGGTYYRRTDVCNGWGSIV